MRLAENERTLAPRRVEDAPAPLQFDMQWERPPMLQFIRLNTPDMVSKDAVREVVAEWLGAVGIQSGRWDLGSSTQGVGKLYTIMFKGAPVTAARWASKAVGGLRRPDGSWAKHTVRAPPGGRTRLFVEADEGPRQVRVEALLRRAFRAARRVQHGLGFRPIKTDGAIAVGWQRVLRVHDPERDASVYELNATAVWALGIRKDAILAPIATADASGSSASAEWWPWRPAWPPLTALLGSLERPLAATQCGEATGGEVGHAAPRAAPPCGGTSEGARLSRRALARVPDLHRSHMISHSAHEEQMTGGAALVVCRTFGRHFELVSGAREGGRCALVTLAAGGGGAVCTIAGVHQHDVSQEQLRGASSAFRSVATSPSAPGGWALSAAAERAAGMAGPRLLTGFSGRRRLGWRSRPAPV